MREIENLINQSNEKISNITKNKNTISLTSNLTNDISIHAACHIVIYDIDKKYYESEVS